MLGFIKLLSILVLVISCEASPRSHHHSRNLRVTQYRLSQDVLPSSYKVDLTLQKDFVTSKKFSGTVVVQIVVNKATSSFQIHMREIDVTGNVVLKDKDGKIIAVTTAVPDTVTDFFTISTTEDLQPGGYSLAISYAGKLSDTDMKGFYLSSYKDSDGTDKYLATTYFEEVGARRAFPCFDEPAMIATFDISITYPNGYNAMSNTKGSDPPAPVDDLVNVTFQTTPKMSTYLVAFIVSEFSCKDQDTIDEIPIQVCSRIGTEETQANAASIASDALQAMRDFTGIPFSKDIGKLNLVAIPDLEIEPTKNWGMVTFREADLFWDAKESSNEYQQSAVTAITHELSHQWFGNLITLSWWSDIYLNEGFATYFQYYATDLDHRDWELPKQFVVEQLQTALLTDSMDSSLPLHFDVSDPATVKARFGDISYNKGGSVLRMAQNFIGFDNFKDAFHDYLTKSLVSTPEYLWAAFVKGTDTLPVTLPEIMKSWTDEVGYPLLTVTLDGNDLVISQKAFVLSGDAPATKWYVPISYTLSNNTEDFAETAPKVWLKPTEDLLVKRVMKDQEWIILNNQAAGYYRVNYDKNLWNLISIALNADSFSKIDEISRSQIVDDLLNLARAGKKEYADVLKFLGFLNKDDSYYSWYSAFNGFNYLFQRTGDKYLRKQLMDYVTKLMGTLYKSTPIGNEKTENQIYSLKQVLAATWACMLNIKGCVDFAKQKFADYSKDTTKKPTPNMKSIVYCNGLRNSNDAQKDYNFLWNQYKDSSLWTEKVTMLKALGCSNSAAVRKQYLGTALTDDVKKQDVAYVFSSVYSNNPEGVDDVLDFIQANYKYFQTRFGSHSELNKLILEVGDFLVNEDQVEKLQKFVNTAVLDEDVSTSAQNAIAKAKTNLDITKNLEKKLTEYFGSETPESAPGSASMTSYHLVGTAFALAIYLLCSFD